MPIFFFGPFFRHGLMLAGFDLMEVPMSMVMAMVAMVTMMAVMVVVMKLLFVWLCCD